MYSFFEVDDIQFDVLIPESGLKQTGDILDTENSQRTQSGEFVRDIVGSFINQVLTVKSKNGSQEDFDTLFDLLINPAYQFHKFKVPYNQGTLIIYAYISSVTRTLIKVVNGVYYWDDMEINFKAKSPYISG